MIRELANTAASRFVRSAPEFDLRRSRTTSSCDPVPDTGSHPATTRHYQRPCGTFVPSRLVPIACPCCLTFLSSNRNHHSGLSVATETANPRIPLTSGHLQLLGEVPARCARSLFISPRTAKGTPPGFYLQPHHPRLPFQIPPPCLFCWPVRLASLQPMFHRKSVPNFEID